MPLGASRAAMAGGGRGLWFRPPAMTDPYVIHAAPGERSFPRRADVAAGAAFNARTHPQDPGRRYFRADQDVIIIWPAEANTAGLRIYGGRHVRSIGGKVAMSTSGPTSQMWRVENVFGSCFVEGFHGDGNDFSHDGVVTRWFQAVADEAGVASTRNGPITIQNCLIEKIWYGSRDGAPPGQHADAFQAQGRTGQLRFENFTFAMTGQGIFLGEMGLIPEPVVTGLWCRRVNGRLLPSSLEHARKWLRSFYLHHGTSSERATADYPIRFDDCWAGSNLPPYESHTRSILPMIPEVPWGGRLLSDPQGAYADFSKTDMSITGVIRMGDPPQGDFVKPENVGSTYVSPWPVPEGGPSRT
jgi:hypothetical protein